MDKEIWKDICFKENGIKWDYTGLYQISNFGRVKSLGRIAHNNHVIKEKIIKTRYDKNGYEIVTLCKVYEKRKDFKVHRLVAFMFIKNIKPNIYKIVNHKDENPKNNCFTNLNWTTTKENNNYGSRNKKIGKPITQYDINNFKIRDWNSAFEVQKTLGYDSSSICKCLKGKVKQSYGYVWKYKQI